MTKVWQDARGKMIGRGGWMGNVPKEIRKGARAEKSMRWKERGRGRGDSGTSESLVK